MTATERGFPGAPPVLVQQVHVRLVEQNVLITFSALTHGAIDPTVDATVFTAVVPRTAMPNLLKMMADASGYGLVRAVPKAKAS
jgi:hypothetical protein